MQEEALRVVSNYQLNLARDKYTTADTTFANYNYPDFFRPNVNTVTTPLKEVRNATRAAVNTAQAISSRDMELYDVAGQLNTKQKQLELQARAADKLLYKRNFYKQRQRRDPRMLEHANVTRTMNDLRNTLNIANAMVRDINPNLHNTYIDIDRKYRDYQRELFMGMIQY